MAVGVVGGLRQGYLGCGFPFFREEGLFGGFAFAVLGVNGVSFLDNIIVPWGRVVGCVGELGGLGGGSSGSGSIPSKELCDEALFWV